MMNYINQPKNVAGNCTDILQFQNQTTKVKWEQQEHDQIYYNSNNFSQFPANNFHSLIAGDAPVKTYPDLENVWSELGNFQIPNLGFGNCGFRNGNGSEYELNYPISRTSSCPPAAAASPEIKSKGSSVLSERMSYSVGKETFKKRKSENLKKSKGMAEGDDKLKKLKGLSEEEESKITNSANNSKVTEVKKPDYIHVRARRGQATDSHSLAERVRREKISERMKYLQDLVPGCNKITGKAGMLDEIINYVQSLQQQVEFLSMKLAVVNPSVDSNFDNVFAKENNFPAIGVSPEMTNPAYIELNSLDQVCSSNFNIHSFSTWDSDSQNFGKLEFDLERSSVFLSQNFTGSIEGSNLKMEM